MAKGKRTPNAGEFVSNEDFIKAWQTCATTEDVATKVGSSVVAVRNRATYLRKKGVELKSYRQRGGDMTPTRVADLNKLAKSCLNGD